MQTGQSPPKTTRSGPKDDRTWAIGLHGVGHQSKLDADVGDVNLRRKDRQPDCTHFAHGRIGHGQHDVEIVNHQIEHHIDVERAWREDRKPMRLKEHRASKLRLNCQNRRVEALEMSGLKDSPMLFGDRNQFVGLRGCGRERLFDEQIEAALKQC